MVVYKSPGVYIKEVEINTNTWYVSKNQLRKMKIRSLKIKWENINEAK